MRTQTEEQQHVVKLLKGFSTALLITHRDNTEPHARPMAVAEIAQDGTIWFITNRRSPKVREISQDHDVLITFQDGWTSTVILRGRALLEKNPALLDRVWSEHFKVWFPGGKDDPDIVLIRVEPSEAEYWDNEGTNKIQYILQATKAYLGGHRPDLKEGDHHGKVRLN